MKEYYNHTSPKLLTVPIFSIRTHSCIADYFSLTIRLTDTLRPSHNKKKSWTRLGRSGDLSVPIPCLIPRIPIRVHPCCSGLGTTCHFFRPLIPIQVRGRKSLSGSSCHSPPPHVPSFLLQNDRSFGLSGQWCLWWLTDQWTTDGWPVAEGDVFIWQFIPRLFCPVQFLGDSRNNLVLEIQWRMDWEMNSTVTPSHLSVLLLPEGKSRRTRGIVS